MFYKTYLDAEDAGKEKKTMMMCLGKIYEHFHTDKYLDKNQFQILTEEGDSSPVVTQSPVLKVTVKESPKKKPETKIEESPKKQEISKSIEEPKKEIKSTSTSTSSELEIMKKNYEELLEKYHNLQEKQATMVYGSLPFMMVIIFMFCLVIFLK